MIPPEKTPELLEDANRLLITTLESRNDGLRIELEPQRNGYGMTVSAPGKSDVTIHYLSPIQLHYVLKGFALIY
jgi:hypothetical protein